MITRSVFLALSSALVLVATAQAQTAPRIPFLTAQVSGAGDGTVVVAWTAAGVRRVQVYAGTDPSHVDHERPVGEGSGDGTVRVSGLPPAARWYFELAPDRGEPLVVADRSLHLSTAGNFRDVGGYRTRDGRWVRMGVAYRSNGLEHLTPAELDAVSRLHLARITDLRTDDERRRGPDRAPAGVPDVTADVLADDADKLRTLMLSLSKPGAAKPAEDPIKAIYRDFVDLPSAERAYHQVFVGLARPGEAPSVFHCTAGKDRTGWADAVLLTILGVPRETIVQDYALTDLYLTGAAARSVQSQVSPSASLKMSADVADLDAAFAEVTRRYGSFDAYLHRGLGLDDPTLAALRANFLAG